MRKVILLIILFSSIKVNALSDIKMDNENLIPPFDKDTRVYNYYTDKDKVIVNIKPDFNETIDYDREIDTTKINEVIINSSINGKYKVNILKDYKSNNEKAYLTNLEIEGYNINFDKNVYEYKINIDNEEYLNINYEVSNDNDYVVISGNGNFNKSDNIILIKLNDTEYKIHAYKTIKVNKTVEEEVKEMSSTKKEIVKIIIVTISSIIVFIFYYIIFINKTILNI